MFLVFFLHNKCGRRWTNGWNSIQNCVWMVCVHVLIHPVKCSSYSVIFLFIFHILHQTTITQFKKKRKKKRKRAKNIQNQFSDFRFLEVIQFNQLKVSDFKQIITKSNTKKTPTDNKKNSYKV